MAVSVFRSQLQCSYREKNSKRFVRTSSYDGLIVRVIVSSNKIPRVARSNKHS